MGELLDSSGKMSWNDGLMCWWSRAVTSLYLPRFWDAKSGEIT